MYLNSITESLRLITTTTAPLHVVANYMDHTASGGDPDSQETIINTVTTTTILAAPEVAGTDRQLRSLTVRNTSNNAANEVKIQKYVDATAYEIIKVTLQVGELLMYSESEARWSVLTSNGAVKTLNAESAATNGFGLPFFKTGTAPEAAGTFYCMAKDAGLPGAWSPGSPGINGRATDGLSALDSGCLCPGDPPAGGFNYVSKFSVNTNVACGFLLIDILWVNTGLVVTNTAAQTLTPVELPPRDRNGTSEGLDIQAGLLVTGPTTNTGVINNGSISYTDSNGNVGNTGALATFPATAVIGTLIPVRLAAGHKGVRSVQSVTLGTSLVSGSVSLVLYRVIDMVGSPNANVGQLEPNSPNSLATGIKIYNRSTMFPLQIPSSTSGTTVIGLVGIRQS